MPFRELPAVLLDEDPFDRGLACGGLLVLAIPAVAAVARLECVADQISILAQIRIGARIGEDPVALQAARAIDQKRQYDWLPEHHHRIGTRDGIRVAHRPRDIFLFVVVAEPDLPQPRWLGATLLELPETSDPQARG